MLLYGHEIIALAHEIENNNFENKLYPLATRDGLEKTKSQLKADIKHAKTNAWLDKQIGYLKKIQKGV